MGFARPTALALLAAPLPVDAQAATRYRIRFLGLSSAADYAPNLQAFHQGVRDPGYEEKRNISIEYRWAKGHDERLPVLAAELIRLNPDVLVTYAAPGIRAARQATTTIAIVMGVSFDPVRLGFVKSFARPGGNTTGVATLQVDLAAARLELFQEVAPTLGQVAVCEDAGKRGGTPARDGHTNPRQPAGGKPMRRADGEPAQNTHTRARWTTLACSRTRSSG